MINTTLFSQRDPRWASKKLGTSTLTIGSSGCAITCLAMLLNSFGYSETPATVNDKLKASMTNPDSNKHGYKSKCLLNWVAVPYIWPLVKFGYRHYNYDNVAVAFQVYVKRIPVIVEVNGAPIGGYRHYVLYVGDRYLLDPWDGKGKPTRSYIAVGDVIYNRA